MVVCGTYSRLPALEPQQSSWARAWSPKKKVGEFSFLQEREGERCKASVDFPFTLRIIG